jgi:hypothetical protein
MIKKIIIGHKTFVEQTTYFVYENLVAYEKDEPNITTSRKDLFDYYVAEARKGGD